MDVLMDTNQMVIPFPWARRQRKWWGGGPARCEQKTSLLERTWPLTALYYHTWFCLNPSHRVNVVGLGGIPKRSFCLWNVETLSEPNRPSTLPPWGFHWSRKAHLSGRQGDVHSCWSPLVFINSLPPLCLCKHSQAKCCPICCLKVFFFKCLLHCLSSRWNLFLLTS